MSISCINLQFTLSSQDLNIPFAKQTLDSCFKWNVVNVSGQSLPDIRMSAFDDVTSTWEPSMLRLCTLQWTGVVCRIHCTLWTRLLPWQILHEGINKSNEIIFNWRFIDYLNCRVFIWSFQLYIGKIKDKTSDYKEKHLMRGIQFTIM